MVADRFVFPFSVQPEMLRATFDLSITGLHRPGVSMSLYLPITLWPLDYTNHLNQLAVRLTNPY